MIMEIYAIKDLEKNKVTEFFMEHWGSTEMVISSGTYYCSSLDGFAVLNEQSRIIGLITYVSKDYECEIISLDSIEEGRGIGSLLIKEVEKIAVTKQCWLIKLVTTNDNLLALKFYQKRGFHLSKVIRNAVESARKLKPEIPLIGNDGIPIRDEIELTKIIERRKY